VITSCRDGDLWIAAVFEERIEFMSEELNRRSFLAAAAVATCACALCPVAHAQDDDEEAPAPLPPGPVDAGPLTNYAKDGGYDSLAKSKQIVLVRENGKLYAMTSLCTHKQFVVEVKDKEFFCPKHSSRFDYDGKPAPKPNGKMGPAKKPLQHYAISVDAKGEVTVDTSKKVAIDDPTAFVKVGS
jgi:nitrite reductase/ring-hydroxylating ferredoxin subunit